MLTPEQPKDEFEPIHTLHRRSSSLAGVPVAPLSIKKRGAMPGPLNVSTPVSPSTARFEPTTPTSIKSWTTGSNGVSSMSVLSLSSPPSLLFPSFDSDFSKLRNRHNAIRELYDTECQFAQDMAVAVKLYLCSSADIGLPPQVIEDLFSNITEILDVSLSLVAILEAHVPQCILRADGTGLNSDCMLADPDVRIGQGMCIYLAAPMYQAFESYSHANKHQMDTCFALTSQRAPAVSRWLATSAQKGKSYTSAWSLDALLIKPVQRLGKYPLFLSTLLENTNPDHPDFEFLKTAERRSRHYMQCINARFECLEPYFEQTKHGN